MNPITTAKTISLMLRNREGAEIVRELSRRFYSNEASYILRRDLAAPFRAPTPKIAISVRPAIASDIPALLHERPRRLPVLVSGIPTCYVATADDGSLCYVQWLISSTGQELLRPFFKGQLKFFPSDTVLLEFAYTFKRFRGLGIMGAAMAQIAERGIELGARLAITYVAHSNIASLKGCAKAGFQPFMLRREKWRAFHLSQSFTNLPADFSYPFEARNQAGNSHLFHSPA